MLSIKSPVDQLKVIRSFAQICQSRTNRTGFCLLQTLPGRRWSLQRVPSTEWIPGHRRQTQPADQNHKPQISRLLDLLSNQAAAGIPGKQPSEQLLPPCRTDCLERDAACHPNPIDEEGKPQQGACLQYNPRPLAFCEEKLKRSGQQRGGSHCAHADAFPNQSSFGQQHKRLSEATEEPPYQALLHASRHSAGCIPTRHEHVHSLAEEAG